MLIRNVNDVVPYLVDGFIHVDKGDYSYVDYVHIGSGFDNHPVLPQCRGLIFDKNGNLIRRPLEKFWNVGERGVMLDSLDFNKPHIIMDKLDGSMVASFILDGNPRLGTRAGITEQSLKCEERHLTEDVKTIIKTYEMFTFVFEFTAPDNQIVLSYPESKMTLLAARHIEYGIYAPRSLLKDFALALNVPLVEQVTMQHLEKSGVEGVVIWFTDDDYFVKIKTDEYVRAHRAVSFLDREDMILPVVLANQIDDIMPLLTEDKQENLRDYYRCVWNEVDYLSGVINEIVEDAKYGMSMGLLDRKAFALNIVAQADERIRSCYFSILDGKNALDVVKEKVLKNPSILKTKWSK